MNINDFYQWQIDHYLKRLHESKTLKELKFITDTLTGIIKSNTDDDSIYLQSPFTFISNPFFRSHPVESSIHENVT